MRPVCPEGSAVSSSYDKLRMRSPSTSRQCAYSRSSAAKCVAMSVSDQLHSMPWLKKAEMGRIVDIQIARLQKLLEDRKIRLELTDAARAWLGRVGYDPVYGARPLKRAVQKYLQDPLADKILSGEIPDGSTVLVDEGDGQLRIQPAEALAA